MRLKRTILSLVMTLAVLAGLMGGTLPAMADEGVWEAIPKNYTESINGRGIWGTSADNVWFAGGAARILHYDGTAVSQTENFATGGFRCVWGGGSNDIYMGGNEVGDSSTVWHYDGTDWTPVSVSGEETVYGIWGTASDNVYTAGGWGEIQHYDGTNWTIVTTPTDEDFYAVWGSAADDIFAVGSDWEGYGYGAAIVHYDGTSWTNMQDPQSDFLRGIWGSAGDNVYAVGDAGTILHYDGTQWSVIDGGTSVDLYGIHGTGPNDIFVVGDAGVVLHYDGTSWNALTSGVTELLENVWTDGNGTAIISGYSSTFLKYTYTITVPSITVDIRATGLNGEVITLAEDYEVPAVEVTEDSCTYDAQTALGAVTYYCQQNSITVDVQDTGGVIQPVQIGDDASDNVTWAYFLNQEDAALAPAVQTLSAGDYVHFYNPGIPDTTIDLRATGTGGDIFATDNYTVAFGTVAEDGYIMDRQTAMGALVTYCQENSIDVTVTDGLYVYQIGTNTGDADSWMYYADGVTPWVSGDQYALTDGEAVHWASYLLGLYSLTLSLDVTGIDPEDTVTATVTYTDGDGVTAAVEAADVYVSDATDSYGYPATPGTSVGQTNSTGELAFTWSTGGTYYPYAEWNGLDTVYQYPVVSFTCTGGTTPDYDVNGDGDIDIFDMIKVGNAFGETGTPGWIIEDVNLDGEIDIFDMITVGNHFGE